jgi:protein SCO1/2
MTNLGRCTVTLALLVMFAHAARAAERYAVTGMVLQADPARRTFVASIENIPGFMAAMTMPFEVRDAKELTGLVPGAIVEFTLVVEKSSSHAEGIRIRRYQSVEQDPLTARRLSLLREIASGAAANALLIGESVPDFTLTDQKSRRLSLSELRGKVVAVNFMYTTCQLPDFCLRVVNHFGVLQKRFKSQLGRELMLLTITFDPVRDQPDVLDRYASQWKADPATWRFLTGSVPEVQRVLEMFGVSAFPDEGLMDHSLHTALIDRNGTLVANIEGNKYSSDQLADLTRSVLSNRAVAPRRE